MKKIEKTVNNIDEDVYEFKGSGVVPTSLYNRAEYYAKEHGIELDIDLYLCNGEDVTAEALTEPLSDGKQVMIGANSYVLYDENGKELDINGGHVVTVSGVTSDGQVIVSTYGEKYYLDIENSDITDYTIVDTY